MNHALIPALMYLGLVASVWILVSPFVIYSYLKSKRPGWACFVILTVAGSIYFDSWMNATFSSEVEEYLTYLLFASAAVAPVWVLISPFLIYKLVKANRSKWAWIVVLTIAGAIYVDYIVLLAFAGMETFRN